MLHNIKASFQAGFILVIGAGALTLLSVVPLYALIMLFPSSGEGLSDNEMTALGLWLAVAGIWSLGVVARNVRLLREA